LVWVWHHVVEPRVLERSKQIFEIGGGRLGPGLFQHLQEGGLAAGAKIGPPFPVAAVEDEHRLAVRQAQHVDEIIRLRAGKPEASAGLDRLLQEQPRRAEIVAGHGLLYRAKAKEASADARGRESGQIAALLPESSGC